MIDPKHVLAITRANARSTGSAGRHGAWPEPNGDAAEPRGDGMIHFRAGSGHAKYDPERGAQFMDTAFYGSRQPLGTFLQTALLASEWRRNCNQATASGGAGCVG